MKKLFIFLVLLFPGLTLADSYPSSPSDTYHVNGYPTASSPQGACNYVNTAWFGLYNATSSTYACYSLNSTAYPSYSMAGILKATVQACPNGGTVSGSTCINAPACISPTIRQSISPYACFTPAECRYPETDNGSGVCANNSCPSGQTRNPTTNLCQIPPMCASNESYQVLTNTCLLNKLACPEHTHASTANDACLTDSPLTCPTGQHDDGTWNCIANTPIACDGNTSQAGYINGQYQCIPKTNTDQKQADSNTATTMAQAANNSNNIAAASAKSSTDNYQAAVNALAADPTNTTKQAAVQTTQAAMIDSNAAAAVAKANADAANKAMDDANAKAQTGLLNSIDQNIKGDDSGNASSSAVLTTLDTGLSANIGQTGFSFLDNLVSLPASSSCQTLAMNYKSLQYTFDPCPKLAVFKAIFGYFLYVMTAYGIYSIIFKPSVS